MTEAQTNFRCHNIFIKRVLDYPTFRHCFVVVVVFFFFAEAERYEFSKQIIAI